MGTPGEMSSFVISEVEDDAVCHSVRKLEMPSSDSESDLGQNESNDIPNRSGQTAISLDRDLGEQEIMCTLNEPSTSRNSDRSSPTLDPPLNNTIRKRTTAAAQDGDFGESLSKMRSINTLQPDPQRDVVSDEQRSNRKRTADDKHVEHTKRLRKMTSTVEEETAKKKEETYGASGLKKSLHGTVYQLKHLMLIMHRARKLKYSFRLATEMDAAEKFDDVVLRYKDSKKVVRYRFLQVKHKQDEDKAISAANLLNITEGDFSLLKYFVSWRKIRRNQIFDEIKSLKDFILCTNIGLKVDDLKKKGIIAEKMSGTDDLLILSNVRNKRKQPRRYKLSIKNSSTMWETLKTRSGSEVTDREISDFLDEFILAVNQPNEIELGEIIERDIGDKFNRLDAGFVRDSFQIKVLDWFKTKEGTFLTDVDADEFFNKMKGELDAIKTMAVGLDHMGKLMELDIRFNGVNTNIEKFINRLPAGSKRLLEIISPKQTLLTALQVYQTLAQRQKLHKNEIFTFVRLETLSRQGISPLVLRAFKWSADENLLVVDCESGNAKKHLQSLWNPICDIMKNDINKRMILITQAGRDLGSECYLDRKTCRVDETTNSFENLTNESQKKLLEKQVTKFQGTKNSINFAELLDISEWDNLGGDDVTDLSKIMDTDSLVKLISEDELEIGCKLKGLEDVGEYYVTRTIFRHVVIKEDILTDTEEPDLLAISGLSGSIKTCIQDELSRIGGPASRAQSRTNLTALARDREQKQFNNLCARNEHRNVHWLIKEQGQYIWKKSHRNITYLLQYRDDRESIDINGETRAIHLNEDQLAAHNEPVIISDTAGMGKSTMLTCLALKMKENKPDMLVLKINLTHHTTALSEVKEKRSYDLGSIDGVIQFLVKELLSGETNFSRKVFKRILKRKYKVAILFDGFDEISPTYEETVIDLLHTLADYGMRKLLVATRPHTRRWLEAKLNAFSFEIRPFSTDDQEKFLTRFWKTKFEDSHHDLNPTAEDRIRKYTTAMMKTLADSIKDQKNEFTAVPLQAKLVAEIFERHNEGVGENFDSCKDFIDSKADEPKFPEKMNLIYLYKHFVEKKFEIFFKKRGGNLGDPGVLADKKRRWKLYVTKHETLALETLFDKDQIEGLQLSQRNSSYGSPDSTDVEDYIERDGIITQLIGGQPRFGHRTYAEYFAANFFSKILKKREPDESFGKIFVAHVLLEDEYKTMRAFINWLLADEYDVLEGEFWTRFVKQHRSYGGKTIFHSAAAEGNHHIVRNFLNCFGANNEDRKVIIHVRDVGDRTAVNEAVEYGHLNVIKLLAEYTDFKIYCQDQFGQTPLHQAVRVGALDVVRYFIDQEADVNLQTNDGDTPLHMAVQSGRSEMVKYLVEKGADVNLQTNDGDTPLQIAVQWGRSEMVKYLLEKEADLNLLTNNGETPLYTAVRQGASKMVEYFLEKGADVNLQTNYGYTPLQTAVQWGRSEMVKYLVEKGADVNLQSNYTNTPLYIAVQQGASEMVEYLLEKGADVNLPTNNGKTPLYTAVQQGASKMVEYLLEKGADVNLITKNGNMKMVEYLLEKGANVNFRTNCGCTLLHAAAKGGIVNIVDRFPEIGADVNLQTNDGDTPLHMAVQSDRSEMVKYLLEKGADVNLQTNDGDTPLHMAVRSDRSEMVKYLLEKEADVNLPTNNGETPLYTAVRQGASKMVEYLLEKGANVNFRTNRGCTLLHAAANGGIVNIVDRFPEIGADVNLQTNDGDTPLHMAVQWGRSEMVKYLLEREADVNLPTNNRETPLYTAVKQGASEMVEYLLEKGANVNFRTNRGCTLLHAAAKRGIVNIVDRFPEIGADVNLQTNDGDTPLHMAVQSDRSKMVKYLLEKGADVNLQTNDGDTPLAIAVRRRRSEMVKYLLEKGADVNCLPIMERRRCTLLSSRAHRQWSSICSRREPMSTANQ